MDSGKLSAKTVQEYIDEKPLWPDGTQAPQPPMTLMQWQIWGLASAGKFFEGLVVFMTGVALPLMAMEFHLNAAQKGMVGAASVFGILVGATALGSLADHFGRKQLFIAEMILFLVFLVAMTLSPNFPLLLVFLFGMGLALGCDYPTAHLVISECLPTNCRGRLILSAFAFQAVGVLVGTAIGYMILKVHGNISDWRLMYAVAIVPTMAVVVGRFFVAQSPQWLMSRGRVEEARKEVLRLLSREPQYPTNVVLKEVPSDEPVHERHQSKFKKLFRAKNRRATVLASVPWFLQDLGTYGIGIFTPTILASILGHANQEEQNLAGVIHNDMIAAEGAAFLDLLLLVGIVGAIFLADRLGRIKLQIFGFCGCAAGLLLAAFSTHLAPGSGQTALVFAGFMLFNFMTNLGPNAMTYLIAGEVFPTEIRGSGAGFAASAAKVGAVATAFLFPMFLSEIGVGSVLYGLVGVSLLGAWVTWRFGIETKGINLESIGRSNVPDPQSAPRIRVAPATLALGGRSSELTHDAGTGELARDFRGIRVRERPPQRVKAPPAPRRNCRALGGGGGRREAGSGEREWVARIACYPGREATRGIADRPDRSLALATPIAGYRCHLPRSPWPPTDAWDNARTSETSRNRMARAIPLVDSALPSLSEWRVRKSARPVRYVRGGNRSRQVTIDTQAGRL